MQGLWQQISDLSLGHQDAIALSEPDSGQSLNYAQLVERVEKLAEYLQQLDAFLSPDSGPLGLLAGNGIDWIVTDLAALAAGRCLIPVPTFSPRNSVNMLSTMPEPDS